MSSQSLPSFAQAFSALDDRDRALPPIHSHSPYLRHDPPPPSNTRHDSARRDSLSNTLPPLKRENRKRTRDRDDSPEPESPRLVKQEQDIDQLEPSPPPPPPPTQTKSPPRKAPSPARPATRARQQLHLNTNVGNTNNNAANAAPSNTNATTATNAQSQSHTHAVPPPPATHSFTRQQQHPSKRRRVTISGVAHPSMSSAYSRSPAHSNAHTPPPPTHTGPSTPISPVVMGFTIQRDPQAFEQVRAMLAVKQKQKALIESRRGSAAGLAGSDINSSGGRRGSTAGVFDGSGGSVSGRRASVAAPSVTVNVVNPTPTTATGPGPGGGGGGPVSTSTPPVVAPPLRRTGSSPNGHRFSGATMTTTPPSLSPNARANASRTRSPSLLGGARVKSPSPHVGSQQQTQLSSRSGPSTAATATSNLSPPSTASVSAPSSHHAHPQASPHSGSTRTRVPSSPHASNSNNPTSSGNNGSNANIGIAGGSAPPSSSSSPPSSSSHANANPISSNPSQGLGGSGSSSGSASGQNQPPQPPPQQQTTFVASQGLSALAHNLPPPPTSFTKRRAGQIGLRGNKPADLMISPRDSESGPPPSGLKDKGSASSSGPQQQHQRSQRQHPPPPLSSTTSTSQSQSQSQSQSHSQGLPPIRRTNQMPSVVPVSAAFKSLQPSIQSAPPRPGQQPGRFPPMALPSLPPVLSQTGSGGQQQGQRGASSIRKTPGQVPPTPTRLSMQRAQGTTESASVRLSQPTALSRVPRTATGATFAIPHLGPPPAGGTTSSSSTTGIGGGSSLAMPSTPATFHRPSGAASRGGGGSLAEKAAFLAPFEQFYDALSDAQVLKGWFGEQLRRVGALAKEGEAQLAKLKSANANNDNSNSSLGSGGMISKAEVETLVREAVTAESRSWREETARLRAQVADLQDLLLHEREKNASTATGGLGRLNGLSPRPTFQPTPPSSTSGAGASINVSGYPAAPGVDSTYTFPPIPGRPPTAPASTYQHHHQHHHHGSRPSQHSPQSYVDERGLRRSVTPPILSDRDRNQRGRDMSEGRSLSRSAASSPVPSVDSSGLGGGIARRLSVSAMRFEKLERVNPERETERKQTFSPTNSKSNGNARMKVNEASKAKTEERKVEVKDDTMDES